MLAEVKPNSVIQIGISRPAVEVMSVRDCSTMSLSRSLLPTYGW